MLLNTSQLKELYNRYDKKNSSLISIPFSAISDEPLKFYNINGMQLYFKSN